MASIAYCTKLLKKVFTTEELIQNTVIMEKHNDQEDVGLINTMCEYMGDDGFTRVTRNTEIACTKTRPNRRYLRIRATDLRLKS